MHATAPSRPIRIGISTCLLGERVRYDGGHKRERFLTETLGQYFEFVPVCPEVEVGMGTPREPIELVESQGTTRLLGAESQTDHTAAMRSYARRRAAELAKADLCGYILKKDSPSCGMVGVRIHHEGRRVTRSGRGLFAEALIKRLPNLPAEEEGRLRDPRLRENWIERVFAYRRLRDLWSTRWRIEHLAKFHAAHKLTLLAHSPKAYGELGRLVRGAKSLTWATLRERYEHGFMIALSKPATPGRQTQILRRAVGHFQERMDEASRNKLLSLIDDYRQGLVPLVGPLTLVAHYVERYAVECLQDQVYLSPHPQELALRYVDSK